MKKIDIISFSILSLILTVVSLVTAAVLPPNSRSGINRFDQRGSITAKDENNRDWLTCTPTANISMLCNVTAASGSTVLPGGSLSNSTTVGDAI